MNSENENNNNEFYKAMLELSLQQLEDRARQAGCKLEVEFDITQGQDSDNGTFQEGGTFIATYTPIPEEEEIHSQINWPRDYQFDIDFDFGTDDWTVEFGINGISEEDFQDYDKIAGTIDLTGNSAYNSMSADNELKAEIISTLQEKQPVDEFDMDAFVREMDEELIKKYAEKTRAIDAFDKAKIDPEAF